MIHDFCLRAVKHTVMDGDLTVRQLAVLTAIYLRKCHPGVKQIATYLFLSKPAVTRCMDRLVFFGLLQRVQDADDRRTITASITEAGIKFIEAMDAHHE